ncbi:BREX-2 system adenine-specific DNA-methyltransferase PglX [Steroidobacter flavus]|uniref:site-specific DNA-methyltransferase (adenine-specific) n=1 Tax=Steroidobacter flavus TaxID=1842136 RepID=A0ABV8SZG4_9GAMM
MNVSNLPKLLQPALKALEKDLLARAKTARVEAGLKKAWEEEQKAGQTGSSFDPWRRERVTQLAVAWILSIVFVRTLEDRGYIDPRVAGASAEAQRVAEDREALFLQIAPFLGPREYLLAVFRELAKLPGARDVFDTKHNPIWVLAPSSEGAQALLDFFRKRDASGAPSLVFTGEDTRFLGDLYQDLSEAARKRYALLQTPEFVEEFILDQTLDPAIAEFGLKDVTLIDPTCGSGHFLLGAFRRLLGRWQQAAPTEHIADLARRALDQVYGVDINPYAVAIARFRLVLALLHAVGIDRLEKAPDLKPNVVAADSLLHRFGERANAQIRFSEQISMDEIAWGDQLFRLENRGAVERVLTKRFHAVVGNPPYITEKDRAKKQRLKERYDSITGRWALSAPFTQRFFELSVASGYIGMINTNAWTKRDYGKVLIEKVLPRFDVQKIIDTSGCYVPGHGTPTLLLFGRNRAATMTPVPAVLGKRGEQETPSEPARAPVWSEITEYHDSIGFDGAHVSVESFTRLEAKRHPWILAGGGARILYSQLAHAAPMTLGDIATTVGVDAITRASDLLEITKLTYKRLGVELESLLPYVNGDIVRDWAFQDVDIHIPVPYSRDSWELWQDLSSSPGLEKFLWPHRAWMAVRFVSGGTRLTDVGRPHWAIPQLPIEKHRHARRIAWGFVATHNHFVLDRDTRLFKQSAPIVTTQNSELDDLGLLGYLNSSTVAFWCRLTMYSKGGPGGQMISPNPWMNFFEFDGTKLRQLPVPRLEDLCERLLDLVIAAQDAVSEAAEHAPEKLVAATLAVAPNLAALREARTRGIAERARLRGILASLQEEMDWRVYGVCGLPTVQAPSVETVRVAIEPNHRPFEVRLARDVKHDVSASEWFRMNARTAPAAVGGPLADLYQQRLRLLDDPEKGRQLRLLETPETKRRWAPRDEIKAFSDAVRAWLLDRMEASFTEQQVPELSTARQLALNLGRDPAVAAAHELLTEESGRDLVTLVSELIDSEGVPFLAGYRYAETGMEKRASWEEAWRLQRLEDEDKLESELDRLGLKAIPVPDKYGPKDYLRHYWRLRGKLDVTKERFITIPSGNTDEDTTPLVGWAGWNHLQVAQALAGLYQRRKTEDGWQKDRLVPLLAGIDERVPWLLQWHNKPSVEFGGTKLGEFFRDFVAGEAHALGVAVGDLRKWTPPAATKRTSIDPSEVLAALSAWKPEVEDVEEDEGDDGDQAELPEGPSEIELASDVGVSKALIGKALKKLIADGLVEKVSGRPARYVATGG